MKTKEQWLEEFREEFFQGYDMWGDPLKTLRNRDKLEPYFSNALEQYAKEYCLEVIEKCKPYHEGLEDRGDGIDDYESTMKKEIGV